MTNPYFNFFTDESEQNLLEDLTIESISMYGHEVYFCPRTVNDKNEIYGEDSLSTYESAHMIDAYITSYDSYQGDGSFLSKFNLEIRDQIRLSIARRTFNLEVGQAMDLTRPREGDLIYSKMMKRLFIISYVNNTPTFYQLGSLPCWDITCEVFEYSSENLMTGVEEIDSIQTRYTTDTEGAILQSTSGYSILDENGVEILSDGVDIDFEKQMADVFENNTEIEDEIYSSGLMNWSDRDPLSKGN